MWGVSCAQSWVCEGTKMGNARDEAGYKATAGGRQWRGRQKGKQGTGHGWRAAGAGFTGHHAARTRFCFCVFSVLVPIQGVPQGAVGGPCPPCSQVHLLHPACFCWAGAARKEGSGRGGGWIATTGKN